MSNEWARSSNHILHSTSLENSDSTFKTSDQSLRIPLRGMGGMQQQNNNSLPSSGLSSASSLSTLIYDSQQSQVATSLENTLRILNDELNLLGFSSIFNLTNSSIHLDVTNLANAAHEIVVLYQQSLRFRESLELQLKRAEADLEHLQRVQKRLQSNVDESDKLIKLCQEKERQLNNKIKSLSTSHKSDKDEIKRLKADLNHTQSQYRHERNKTERELSQLRDRLHTVMTSQRSSAPHMDLLNCLQKMDGKRRTWAMPKGGGLMGEKSKDDLHQYTLRQMEAKQEEMLLENKDLRRCLFSMQRRLDTLLNGHGESGSLSDDGDSVSAIKKRRGEVTGLDDDLWRDDVETKESGLFHLPYDLMRENVERSLEEKVELLRALISEKVVNKKPDVPDGNVDVSAAELPAKSPRRPSHDIMTSRYREEMEQLKKQIEQYENVIENQEKLLKKSLINSFRKPSSDPANDFLKDKDALESQQRLAAERRAFYEQKAEFEREKTNFSEAAMHLCRERKTLDDEKANFLRQQLMLLTPRSRPRLPTAELRRNSIATTSLTLTPSKSSFTPAPPESRTDSDVAFIGFSKEDLPTAISEASHETSSVDPMSPEHKSMSGTNPRSQSTS